MAWTIIIIPAGAWPGQAGRFPRGGIALIETAVYYGARPAPPRPRVRGGGAGRAYLAVYRVYPGR